MTHRKNLRLAMAWTFSPEEPTSCDSHSPSNPAVGDDVTTATGLATLPPLRRSVPDPVRSGYSFENFVFAFIALLVLASTTWLIGSVLAERSSAPRASAPVASRGAVLQAPRAGARP
ncbi:MAG: hypothetical protein JO133_10045 [Burkholderiaceae bacterium]|nr:hypothetical protein [Burkholderiaceae bacterium]